MKNTVIRVENLSKQYRLGQLGSGTLADDIHRVWAKLRGKEDPLLKIGDVNDRSMRGDSDYVWSLKDINFEVHQGDVLGIIGRNGAGKSTLLKILSKVTGPTTGSVKVKGRVASLLEVGTGFHPELSGRENIFLNGAILGMNRQEIKAKFDEIVAFSGVERYIDTPVKRYSSGMYVRLAFAVAAHLESEILIVDEVLAVGDAEFQKKCLGKMNDVAKGEGRTVLFVSHNMAAVKSLCNNGIILDNGCATYNGDVHSTIIEYQKRTRSKNVYDFNGEIFNAIGNQNIRIKHFSVLPKKGELISISSGLKVKLVFLNNKENINLDATFELRTHDEIPVFHSGSIISSNNDSRRGYYEVNFELSEYLLNAGHYYFKLIFGENQKYLMYSSDGLVSFNVENESQTSNMNILPGVIYPKINFENHYYEH